MSSAIDCVILDDYQDAASTSADWSKLDARVRIRSIRKHLSHEDQLVSELANAGIAVIMRERTRITASLLAKLPRLKLLVTSGLRNSAIDLAAAKAKGVVVCGTQSFSEPPAELAWALILALARNIVVESGAIRENGPWQSTVGTDLFGSRIGLLGLGKIGSKMARIALAFGMDVVAWSPNLKEERAREVGARLVSKEELLSTSDFVSIHLVLGDRSRGLLQEVDLKRMKRSAYLVNTSRAPIVDSPSLVTALQEGWIAGAGLDVFDVEPLPERDVLRSLPNVLATPHLGYVSKRNYRAYFGEAIEDINAFLAGSPIRKLAAPPQ